ncbi:pentapeptide repeat-containing protein [Staphylococcus aureus]
MYLCYKTTQNNYHYAILILTFNSCNLHKCNLHKCNLHKCNLHLCKFKL